MKFHIEILTTLRKTMRKTINETDTLFKLLSQVWSAESVSIRKVDGTLYGNYLQKFQ